MKTWFCIASTCLIWVASPALAATPDLPNGLTFCDDRSTIEGKLGELNELTDEMLEATLTLWGLEGVLRVVLEEQKLVTARFRVYESPAGLKTIKNKLGKGLGEAAVTGDPDEAGYARKYTWSPGESVTVEMSRQSDSLYATWEVPPERCAAAVTVQEGPTDQEKADMDAMSNKKAIEFDVFSEDLEEREKQIEDEKKKKAEEEARKDREAAGEEEDEESGDIDIDW
jgi:hypothetical protein